MRRIVLLTLALAGGLLCAPAADDKSTKTLGSIERKDKALDDLLPKDAKLEILGEGYNWVEGPVWRKKQGDLLFSDIPSNSVYKYKPGEGISLYLRPSGYTGKREDLMEPGSNGLLIDPKGRLVLMQHGDRCVARLNEDGKTFTRLAEKVGDKRLNSPNDGAYKSNGDLYFTDPPYGQMLKGKAFIFPEEELGYRGVYRLTPGGKLTLLTKELQFPNGLAFSPDEKTVYVAQSDPKKAIWMKFPVKEDGTLGKGSVLFDATAAVGAKPGLPDGLKVDVKGNLWATGPGGVFILTPEGKHIGTIVTGVPTGNCCFGDDGSTLYVMCDKAIGRIKTKTKGAGF